MYTINDQQIDYILNDIRRRGVEMEDLQSNLLDHICCIVEQNLDSDGDFEDFYKKTIPKFFKHELWEIEEETINLLIFKNYYTMKKTMIISGSFAAFAIILGAFFKVMHWPGANILLILGIGTLSFIFLPIMFTLKIKKKSDKKEKFVLYVGSIAATLIGIASLFKVMHWPFTSILLYVSIGMLLLVFLPVFFITGIRNPETKVNTIVTTVLILAGTGLMMVLSNKSPSLLLSKATVNYMRNENSALQDLKSIVIIDSSNSTISEVYTKFMLSADRLKDAIAKSISGVDFATYLNDDEHITPSALSYAQLNEFPEKEDFVNAVIAFETISKSSIYHYDNNMGFEAAGRNNEIDFALMLQPHVKDLMSFISNLQTKATLSVIKK